MAEAPALDPDRYVNEAKRILAATLAHELASTEFAEWWARVGSGVDVFWRAPQTPPETGLTRPRVAIIFTGEERRETILAHEGTLWAGAYCELSFEVACIADEHTGGQVTADDLATAVVRILQAQSDALQAKGMLLLGCNIASTDFDADTGTWTARVTARFDVTVYERALG
jgi:hypothetical protein